MQDCRPCGDPRLLGTPPAGVTRCSVCTPTQHDCSGTCAQADEEGSLELLQQREPPLATPRALDVLNAAAPHLAAPYLENRLATAREPPPGIHQRLALIYLRRLTDHDAPPPPRPPTAPAAGATPRHETPAQRALDPSDAAFAAERLLSLSQSPETLDVADLQARLPGEAETDALRDPARAALLQLRALLYEHEGKFEAAMGVYVRRLRSPALAEACADRLYDALVVRSHLVVLWCCWGCAPCEPGALCGWLHRGLVLCTQGIS